MQQRFSNQEQQQLGFQYTNTAELLKHPWIVSNSTVEQLSTGSNVHLNLKELLQISNDNGSVSNLKGGISQDHENISEDFQQKQIERIVEAISLTLPAGGGSGLAYALGS